MRFISAVICCFATVVSFAATEPGAVGVDLVEPVKRELLAGQPDKALSELAAAEKRGLSEAYVFYLRGLCYLEMGKYDEALAALRASEEKDPTIYGPRLRIGDTLLRSGKWAEAREVYQQVMQKTNILILNERLRYAILLTFLGAKDDAGGKDALDAITFPTESPSYYYGQAAWAFAHGDKKAGEKWIKTADEIFEKGKLAWYARPLHDFGWVKTKPPPTLD